MEWETLINNLHTRIKIKTITVNEQIVRQEVILSGKRTKKVKIIINNLNHRQISSSPPFPIEPPPR